MNQSHICHKMRVLRYGCNKWHSQPNALTNLLPRICHGSCQLLLQQVVQTTYTPPTNRIRYTGKKLQNQFLQRRNKISSNKCHSKYKVQFNQLSRNLTWQWPVSSTATPSHEWSKLCKLLQQVTLPLTTSSLVVKSMLPTTTSIQLIEEILSCWYQRI